MAHYEPPGKLRPAEIAFLYDRSFGQAELLATLFDLELRQKVILHALPGKKTDFTITLTGKTIDPTLAAFEQEILLSVAGQKKPARWSLLSVDNAIWDSGIEVLLETSLQQRGYFWRQGLGRRRRWLFFSIGVVTSFVAIILPLIVEEGWFFGPPAVQANQVAQLSDDLSLWFTGGLWLLVSLLYGLAAFGATWCYGRALDMEKGTALLRRLWPRLEGFREYLQVVEQPRIVFENQHLKTLARQQAFPYAIALDLRTDWQARFR